MILPGGRPVILRDRNVLQSYWVAHNDRRSDTNNDAQALFFSAMVHADTIFSIAGRAGMIFQAGLQDIAA